MIWSVCELPTEILINQVCQYNCLKSSNGKFSLYKIDTRQEIKIVNGAGQMMPGTHNQGLRANFPSMENFQLIYDGFLKHILSSWSLTDRSEMGAGLMETLGTEY